MDNGELILICFIFLIVLIYVASYSRECAVVAASIVALIAYVLNSKNKSGYTCVTYDSGARQEQDAMRLLGTDLDECPQKEEDLSLGRKDSQHSEGYLDYNQNLLSDYPSEPYMVSPSLPTIEGKLILSSKPVKGLPKDRVLTFGDLDLNYPGAVELDQIESSDYTIMGHVDAQERKVGPNMPGDITFDLNRTQGNDDTPDEWDSSAVLDGDEQIVNSERARALNANVRADMGTIRRKEFMDRFVTDELNEAADEIWWGRADY